MLILTVLICPPGLFVAGITQEDAIVFRTNLPNGLFALFTHVILSKICVQSVSITTPLALVPPKPAVPT